MKTYNIGLEKREENGIASLIFKVDDIKYKITPESNLEHSILINGDVKVLGLLSERPYIDVEYFGHAITYSDDPDLASSRLMSSPLRRYGIPYDKKKKIQTIDLEITETKYGHVYNFKTFKDPEYGYLNFKLLLHKDIEYDNDVMKFIMGVYYDHLIKLEGTTPGHDTKFNEYMKQVDDNTYMLKTEEEYIATLESKTQR